VLDVIRAKQSLAGFDFDASGDVTEADINYLLANIVRTHLGDANLDGATDAMDFEIWNQNQFTNCSTWSRADFNGDGVTCYRPNCDRIRDRIMTVGI
jgi:hypothetical protein